MIPRNRISALAVPITLFIFDVVVLITTLTLGILGLVGGNPNIYISGMSSAASYALIGVGSGITLLYFAMFIQSCVERSRENSKQVIGRNS